MKTSKFVVNRGPIFGLHGPSGIANQPVMYAERVAVRGFNLMIYQFTMAQVMSRNCITEIRASPMSNHIQTLGNNDKTP